MGFKVGDKVRHIHRPDWGVGKVKEVDMAHGGELDYVSMEYRLVLGTAYNVEYPDWHPDHNQPAHKELWWTAEGNLVAA